MLDHVIDSLSICGTLVTIVCGWQLVAKPCHNQKLIRWIERETGYEQLSSLFDPLISIFDHVFGSRHISIRCFGVSIVCTSVFFVLALLLAIALGLDSDYVMELLRSPHKYVLIPLIALFIWNIIVDYISLIQTRFFIGVMREHSGFWPLLAIVYADIILTASVFVFLFPFGIVIAMFLFEKFGAGEITIVTNDFQIIKFANYYMMNVLFLMDSTEKILGSFLYTYIYLDLSAMYRQLLDVDAGIYYGRFVYASDVVVDTGKKDKLPISAFYATTFFTSIWIYSTVFFAMLSKSSWRLLSVLIDTTRFFNWRRFPIAAIGVAGSFIFFIILLILGSVYHFSAN